MKLIKSTILLGCLIVMGANAKPNDKSVANTEIKCHVELVGGGDIIHFAKVPETKLAVIKQVLEGQKISTTLSKKKRVIYKVNECVGLHETFVTTAAKSKDILTAR
ncbi:TapY2 family type IVa secretion system protein [Colwelliaceae bacterium 6471]